MAQNETIGLSNRLSENGYEIRVYDGGKSQVHVGLQVSDEVVDPAFSVLRPTW